MAAVPNLALSPNSVQEVGPAQPIRGVRVMRIAHAPAVERRSHAGVVAARWDTSLGFRVGGKIIERRVEVGQAVSGGDTLFMLDPADYQASLRAAEAELSAAQAQDRQARAEAARQFALLQRGFATHATHERVLAAAATADEQVNAARQKRLLASNQLGYTSLASLHDGIVTGVSSEVGQVVAPGQAVVTIARSSEREAVIAIPETQTAGLSGWRASAALWGADGKTFPVLLRELGAQADPVSRTFAARFSLPADLAARAGLGASLTVHLERDAAAATALVPSSAVFFREARPFVWRVASDGNRVEAVAVTLLELGAETGRITGLDEGDRIVTIGVHRLDPDLAVRVVEEVTPARLAP